VPDQRAGIPAGAEIAAGPDDRDLVADERPCRRRS
jgi:hypothetical protein